jgi:hypothetical protein
MNIDPVQIALLLLGACLGWHLRGLTQAWRVRKDQSAWRRARHFLPSETSKN